MLTVVLIDDNEEEETGDDNEEVAGRPRRRSSVTAALTLTPSPVSVVRKAHLASESEKPSSRTMMSMARSTGSCPGPGVSGDEGDGRSVGCDRTVWICADWDCTGSGRNAGWISGNAGTGGTLENDDDDGFDGFDASPSSPFMTTV